MRIVKELFSNLEQNKLIYHFSYLNLYVLIRNTVVCTKPFVDISKIFIYYSSAMLLLSSSFHKHLKNLKHTFPNSFLLKDFKTFHL